MRANLVECSDHDVVYGILTVENVSLEEVQRKIYEIKNDEKFLEENPYWTVDDVFEHFPEEWEWNYDCGADETIEI
jgi:hypothetical protein